MPKFLFSIFLVMLSGITIAQTTGPEEQLTFLERNFFHHVRTELMYGAIPSFKVWSIGPDGKPISEFESTANVISLGGVAYEPRVNLFNFRDRASISLSIPFDLVGGIVVSHPNDLVASGIGAASIGFFIDANIGNHSTYNNIEMNGSSFGIGYRLHKAPLFRTIDRKYKFSRIASGLSVRFQYKHDFQNDLNKIWYIESGLPNRFIDDGISRVANLYLTFGFGRLLNY